MQTQSSAALDQHMPKSLLGYVLLNRVSSDGSALKSHFDDWAHVLNSEAETSLSRRGSGKLHGLEPDMLRSTVDGILKRQPVPSKLQPNLASPRVRTTTLLYRPMLQFTSHSDLQLTCCSVSAQPLCMTPFDFCMHLLTNFSSVVGLRKGNHFAVSFNGTNYMYDRITMYEMALCVMSHC